MLSLHSFSSITGLLAIFLALKVLFEMAFGVRKKKCYEDYLGIFTRQIFAMVKANLPLGPGVKTLSYPGMKKCVKRIHSEIEKDLEDGIHLSQALARHPKVFPGWYISMVVAGEESGNMEATFEQILKHHESMTTFGRNIAWPVGYFAMLILYITSISLSLNKVIMPAFYKIIREIEKSLDLSITYHRY
ncbi:MAG: type II secretion system F family protein, partial [Planctomycetes bacterium]|nr:type II secretion system F family protein [Planctomycetota bacterium]